MQVFQIVFICNNSLTYLWCLCVFITPSTFQRLWRSVMGKYTHFSFNVTRIFSSSSSSHICIHRNSLWKIFSIPRGGCRMGLKAVIDVRVCFHCSVPLVPALHLLLSVRVLSVTVGWGQPLVQTWGAFLPPLSRLLQEPLIWFSCSKIQRYGQLHTCTITHTVWHIQ